MYGGTRCNMGMTEEGIAGEQKLQRYLHSKGVTIFQPDGIGLSKDEYAIYEVKMKKEPFQPPPFLGHGLEIYQVKARLSFYKKTGIRCRFVVFQTKDSVVCSAWLDNLDRDLHFDTKNGIRIYPLDNFDIEHFGDADVVAAAV